MAEAVQQYGQISLGSRDGVSQGQVKITGNGIFWKGSNKTVEIKKDEIESLIWTKLPRGCQLGVRRQDNSTINLNGFKEKDLESVGGFCDANFSKSIKEVPFCTSGRNWGSLDIHGKSLMFTVDGRVGFEVPLPDVSTATAQKDDVVMELHVDDTATHEREDTLAEITFAVPQSCEAWPVRDPDSGDVSAKMVLEAVLEHTDSAAASSQDAVFEVSLFPSHLELSGQNQEYKVRYQNITRLFVLPKTNPPNTVVILSLDPPIRKGHTYYAHLQCQFPNDEEATIDLEMSAEAIAARNEKLGKPVLQPSLSGPLHELFVRILRGLSAAKVTKPGAFRNADGEGASVRCSYKTEDGHLYPLDRAFFYVHKPPVLVAYDDVEGVEFARQAGAVHSSSIRTFDLVVRTRSDQEHQFRNINRTEWQNLFEFISTRKLRIDNLAVAQGGPGAAGSALDVGDDLDPGMQRARAEADDDEDDDDFNGGSDGSSEDSDSDASSDAEMIDEEGISAGAMDNKKGGKGRKPADEDGSGSGEDEKPAAPPPKKAKAEPKPKKESGGGGGDKEPGPSKPKAGKKAEKEVAEGGKAKPVRKKKDPNAPKNAISAFMYFSSDQRAKVKEDHPDIAFGDIAKMLGERWKALSADDRVPYTESAAQDKARYSAAMEVFKAGGGGGGAAPAQPGGRKQGPWQGLWQGGGQG
ncbi:MAG: hypothetical protein WDW36_002908 [Sanguina aurantia]